MHSSGALLDASMSRGSRIALALTLVAALSPSLSLAATRVCMPEGDNRIVLARSMVDWPLKSSLIDYPINLRSTVFALYRGEGSDAFVDRVLVSIYDARCAVKFQATYGGDSGRVRTAWIGSTPIINLISEQHGGSGNGFEHHLLVAGRNGIKSGLKAIEAPNFSHTNMGGFFIGSLGAGRGEGVVVWDAIWESDDQTHYSPHRYKFRFYRWNGNSFESPTSVETDAKFNPSPDVAAAGAGYPFRDQTGQDDMPWVLVGGPQ